MKSGTRKPSTLNSNFKVLALSSYPVEAAATRYRLTQFVEPLAKRGVELTVRPFLDSRLFALLYRRGHIPRVATGLLLAALRRLGDVITARKIDVLLVQREAMMFGPPITEWLMMKLRRYPMVLDLDDATYVRYTSPTYGRVGSALKWFRKTDDLIRWAEIVICGNRTIAEYVSSKGRRAVVIPTVVDTVLFSPRRRNVGEQGVPVIGWIGTHSTYPFLESIFPVLERLAHAHSFCLKVVGAGRSDIRVSGVGVENLEWSLTREVADFQSFDIGLYPLHIGGSSPREWAAGKSGFKAIQYMAVGIPYVVTPVGTCAEIGQAGITHFSASSPGEWCEALARLLSDTNLRERMGEAGRRYALQNFTVAQQADKLVAALHEAKFR